MNNPIPPPGVARIRSIPTTYNGITFRSRLEADWARFFDAYDLRWAYESEGFDLDGLWYLPDFWLPDIRTVVEVKGIMDGASEEKIRRLLKAVERNGDPESYDGWSWHDEEAPVIVVAEAPVPWNFSRPVVHDNGAFELNKTDIAFVRCVWCGGWYWIVNEGYYGCRYGCCYTDNAQVFPDYFSGDQDLTAYPPIVEPPLGRPIDTEDAHRKWRAYLEEYWRQNPARPLG